MFHVEQCNPINREFLPKNWAFQKRNKTTKSALTPLPCLSVTTQTSPKNPKKAMISDLIKLESECAALLTTVHMLKQNLSDGCLELMDVDDMHRLAIKVSSGALAFKNAVHGQDVPSGGPAVE